MQATSVTTTTDRRTRIVDAAVTVFSAHGFDAGTIRQIAREAGVAEGLIYHYFEGKEALLDAIIRDRSVLAWLVTPNALPEDAPVHIALRELVSQALLRLDQNRDLVAIVWSQVATNPKLAARLGLILREMNGRVVDYLERKIARGELRAFDTEVAARTLAGSLITFTLHQSRLSPPLPYLSPQSFGEALVDLLMHGMGSAGSTDQPTREEATVIDVE